MKVVVCKTKSESFREAEARLEEFRKELARIAPDHPTKTGYRKQFKLNRPSNEIHDAVETIVALGDAYDMLTLCLEIERALKQSADVWERTETLLEKAK